MHSSLGSSGKDHSVDKFLTLSIAMYVAFGLFAWLISWLLLKTSAGSFRTIISFGFVTYIMHLLIVLNESEWRVYVRHNRIWTLVLPIAFLTLFSLWQLTWQTLLLIAFVQSSSYGLALLIFPAMESIGQIYNRLRFDSNHH